MQVEYRTSSKSIGMMVDLTCASIEQLSYSINEKEKLMLIMNK
jgi:hypothetical protein